jgi:hypothetical protein
MRKWVSAAAILAALVSVQPVFADSPGSVYSDFAEDGVLSCNHSRSALNGVLKDASLYQYGDPLTLLRLKLAIRRQLSGGCRRTASSSGSAGSRNAAEPDLGAGAGAVKTLGRRGERSTREPKSASAATKTAGQRDGRMVLLGVGLLLLTLGSGGWAARRAFAARQ